VLGRLNSVMTGPVTWVLLTVVLAVCAYLQWNWVVLTVTILATLATLVRVGLVLFVTKTGRNHTIPADWSSRVFVKQVLRRVAARRHIGYGAFLALLSPFFIRNGDPSSLVALVALGVLPALLFLVILLTDSEWKARLATSLLLATRKAEVPPLPFQEPPTIENYGLTKSISGPVDGPLSSALAIARILGNDLPPRHSPGQSLNNLSFILEHETPFPGATKFFILNRIVDPEQLKTLRRAVEKAGHECLTIPFDPEEFRNQPLDFDCLPQPDFLQSKAFDVLPMETKISALNAVYRMKNCYAINNNGARNVAIEHGLAFADWALPLDGNIFVPDQTWEGIAKGGHVAGNIAYWMLPMERIVANESLLRKTTPIGPKEEPQIAFAENSKERFDESIPYGRRPKVDLLWKLGVPGPWSDFKLLPWDQPFPAKSSDYGRFGIAGTVFRLNSGVKSAEVGWHQSRVASNRNRLRDAARLKYLVSLEKRFGSQDSGNSLHVLRIAENLLAEV
jgi:hypothetical protein